MSTPRNSRPPLRGWRIPIGMAIIGVLVIASALTLGLASGSQVAQHGSGDPSAAQNAMSSTHSLSRAQGHASSVSRASGHAAQHSLSASSSSLAGSSSLFPSLGGASRTLASITGCGADGTIADASGFEDADGNLNVDTTGCIDWNSFSPTWTGSAPFQTGTATLGDLTFAGATDAVNSSSDSIYAGGVKQDTECPAVTTGNANDKADLARIYIAGEKIGDQTYLFLSWERQLDTTVNSDVFVSFEFNQSQVSCGAGSPFVERTAGDVLFDYNFQSGNSTITAEQWDGSAWQPLPTPPFEASVNSGTVTDTIGPSGSVDLTKFEFGEAGINLSSLNLTGNGGKACETFGSVLGGSRTSESGDTAQLKDFVGPAPIDISNCATPTIATQTSVSSMTLGDTETVGDTATLSNGNDPTGDVSFQLYSDADCQNAVDGVSGTATLVNGVATFAGAGFTPDHAGTYYWGVSYPGDDNNAAASSCGGAHEEIIVNPAQPSIVTTQDPASGGIGDTYKDTATLSEAVNLDGTGSITFKLYDAADCGGSVLDTETVDSIAANGDYSTPDGFQIQNAGTYYWVASFSGDSNNLTFTSGCNDEPVAVAKSQPSILTTQNPDSGAIGDTFKDTATLSGAANPDGTGSITFKLYDAADCGGSVLDTETVDGISANGDYSTPDGFQIQNAGTYYWVASFTGDSNNLSFTSGCNDEPVSVGLNQPSIATTQDPASGAIGATYKDTATLSDAASLDGTGSITFTLYAGTECDATVLDTETVDGIIANGDYTTPDGFQIQNAGTYYWVASFSGDSNNNDATSGCNDEPVVVAPNSPSIATLLSSSAVNHGGTVHDSAQLSGATSDAGGTVTYSVYSNSSCTTKVADGGTVNVTDGSVPNSNGITFNTPGTFYWQASYSGDPNNKAAVSPCTSEKLVVAPLVDLAVTKVGSPNPVSSGANITWTMVVKNNGPDTDTGVTISDPLPAANTFVSVSTTQGTCTGGAIISCNIGTMAAGATVTITLVTTPTQAGTVTNTVTVVGNATETNTANNTASASVVVKGITPPAVFCTAVSKVAPKQLFVGRNTTLTIHVTKQGKAVKGVRVLIKGPKLNLRTKPSNSKGVIKQQVKMKKAGIVTFTPIASKRCNTKRVGVTGVFTPPVTG